MCLNHWRIIRIRGNNIKMIWLFFSLSFFLVFLFCFVMFCLFVFCSIQYIFEHIKSDFNTILQPSAKYSGQTFREVPKFSYLTLAGKAPDMLPREVDPSNKEVRSFRRFNGNFSPKEISFCHYFIICFDNNLARNSCYIRVFISYTKCNNDFGTKLHLSQISCFICIYISYAKCNNHFGTAAV